VDCFGAGWVVGSPLESFDDVHSRASHRVKGWMVGFGRVGVALAGCFFSAGVVLCTTWKGCSVLGWREGRFGGLGWQLVFSEKRTELQVVG
jgi:hypothetical protein